MKINAKFIERLYTSDNKSKITLLVSNYQHQQWISELDNEKEYSVEIKEVKSKRSLNQNAYFWKLLHELEIVSKQDIMIWYAHLLEETNCKFEYLMGMPEIESYLKDAFRAVKKVAPRTVNGKEVMVYKCFIGSSRYTIAEMQELIEVLLKYCAEYGIQTDMFDYET